MPTTTEIEYSDDYSINPYIYSLSFTMFGATGGGENIKGDTALTRTAGTSGGTTSFLGFTLTGGVGGGVTTKNAGGQGGGATAGFTWSGAGTSVASANGNRGSLPTGGIGAYIGTIKQDGGGGSSGYNTYVSGSTHFFDNARDVHDRRSSGATEDVIIDYENETAEGAGGFTPSGGKYYSIRFVAPFANNSWTISITTSGSTAAGGGTGGAPYSLNGTNNKNANGINIWFQTAPNPGESYGSNSYIRDFEITATGLKPGATGRGGGGAAVAYGTISRASLEATEDYAPGEAIPAVIGSAGTAGGTVGGCSDGVAGKITVVATIYPQVYLTSDRLILNPANPSATLDWITKGDADAIRWPSNGDVTNLNLESTATVSPAVTTTYTAEAYNTSNSDLVSFNSEASVTIVVISAPAIGKFEVPAAIDYGTSSFNVVYETEYANTSLELEFFNSGYIAGPNDGTTVLDETVVLTTAGSAESGNENKDADGTVIYNPQWDSFGPREIVVRLTADGDGGNIVLEKTVIVNIDETPDNINVKETEDKGKDQDPVYTPDITPEVVIESQLYLIDDIDIPVTIKADNPILVQVNKDGSWRKVEQI